jgi:hypothetical protein
MLAPTEDDSGDLGQQDLGIILGVQELLEALDALGSVEELLVCLNDLVDPVARKAEVLCDEGCAVCCEDPIGKFQIEQPIPGARRHLARAVHKELTCWLVAQQQVFDAVFVVRNTNHLHTR